jgi:hypothetical protein
MKGQIGSARDGEARIGADEVFRSVGIDPAWGVRCD